MEHPYEYTMLQQYIPVSAEQMKYGSSSEEFRLPFSDAIYKSTKDLRKRINTHSMVKEDYEVKSHSLTFAPDGKIAILTILLQHHPIDVTSQRNHNI